MYSRILANKFWPAHQGCQNHSDTERGQLGSSWRIDNGLYRNFNLIYWVGTIYSERYRTTHYCLRDPADMITKAMDKTMIREDATDAH